MQGVSHAQCRSDVPVTHIITTERPCEPTASLLFSAARTWSKAQFYLLRQVPEYASSSMLGPMRRVFAGGRGKVLAGFFRTVTAPSYLQVFPVSPSSKFYTESLDAACRWHRPHCCPAPERCAWYSFFPVSRSPSSCVSMRMNHNLRREACPP